MEERKIPRSIDELAGIPKTEMTEEELDIWINFQCDIAARDAAFAERCRVAGLYMQSKAAVYGRHSKELLEELKSRVGDITNGEEE